MNMLQYELFASVARTLNLSKTAQQYYISQPAVSHHIKSLEDSLGVELINRTKRGVTLTDAGKEFLPYVQEILALNVRAENRMYNISKGIRGHVKIATLTSESNHLSACLTPFYNEHPDVQADISVLDGSEMNEALRNGTHDFYFAVNPMTPDNMGYEYRQIASENMALYVNSSIAHTIDMNDWSTISCYPFVSVPKSDTTLNNKIISMCRARGFTPKIINYYNRAEAVILSVNTGVGVAIMPKNLQFLYMRPNVVTFPVEGPDSLTESIFVWNPEKLTSTGELFKKVALSTFNLSDED